MQKSAKDPAKEGATEELKNQLRKVQKWAEDPAKEGVAKEQSGVQVIYQQKKRIINSTQNHHHQHEMIMSWPE